ncbi:MAG: cytochrome c3 family protein [Pseudomonadota bacterium]|jgi:predicted CXXCH cytochrome family protein
MRILANIAKLLIATAAAVAILPFAAQAGVVGSRHDLSNGMGSAFPHGAPNVYTNYGQVCVYCHTPHSANTDNNGKLLWNRPFSTASYTLYSSPTSKLTPTQPTGASSSSALCLSCHDGTIAVDSILRPPKQSYTVSTTHRRMDVSLAADSCGACHNEAGIPGPEKAFLGTDLSNDHPVNMIYDNTVNTGLAPAATVTSAGLKLYEGNKVQCATCHDPHNTNNGPFLRTSNAASALCQTCHTK